MRIENDKLVADGIEYKNTSKKSSGRLDRKFLVIHYTASDNYEADVRTLSSANVQASCHLVIGPNGEITQIGDFNDVLWHAGKSSWKGYTGLNRYSIGIEVTSPGPVEKVSEDGFKTWYGKHISWSSGFNFVYEAHKNGGPKKYWAGFTEKQIEVLSELVPLLMNTYGLEAVGHDDIAPGRKIDPGPCMPENLWAKFESRELDSDSVDDTPPETLDDPSKDFINRRVRNELTGKAIVKLASEDSKLNVRRSPDGEIIGKIYHGLIVNKLMAEGPWVYIKTPGGYTGWVYGSYLSNL